MKILIDMNLSPDWREILVRHGWESVHWSAVGKPTAPDKTILQYARENGYVVLTHDLDFSAILAATGANAPSVIQVRTQDVLSERFQKLIIRGIASIRICLGRRCLSGCGREPVEGARPAITLKYPAY